MDPNPLIWVRADEILNYFHKLGVVGAHVCGFIDSARQLHRRLEAQNVFLRGFVPECVARNYRSIRAQRDSRETCRTRCRNAKEWNEYAFLQRSILIGENSNCPARVQSAQDGPRRIIFINHAAARKAAISIY